MFSNEPIGDHSPSPSAAWRRRRDRLAALESSINAQERDERQRAVRALLRQPLLAPDGGGSLYPCAEHLAIGCAHGSRITPAGN